MAAERLAQRQQLIGVEPDAGAKRRLQQVAIRRGRGVPFEGAEIGRKGCRVVGAVAPQPRPEIILETPGADLGVPCDFERFPLRVVRDARELERGKTFALVVDSFDEPEAPAHLDEITDVRVGIQNVLRDPRADPDRILHLIGVAGAIAALRFAPARRPLS